MQDNNQQEIRDSFDSQAFIGKTITFENSDFEIVSILDMGMEKIVYELMDIKTRETSHVLRIYRKKMSKEQFGGVEAKYNIIKKALEDAVLETHFLYIDDWPAEIQPHLAPPGSGNLLITSHGPQFFNHMSKNASPVRSITEMYIAGEFEHALAECETKLEEFPLNPNFLAIKGGCLLALERTKEAIEVLELCVEIEPNEARHYINLAQAYRQKGEPGYARALAYQSATYAKDSPVVWKFLFNFEVSLGHVKDASHCLEKLKRLENTSSILNEMNNRLKTLSAKTVKLDQDMENALEIYRQGDSDGAFNIIKHIKEEAPYYTPALFLAGIIAIERHQWLEAISTLGQVLALDIRDQENKFYLGYAHTMNGYPNHGSLLHHMWLDEYFQSIQRISKLLDNAKETRNELIVENKVDWYLLTHKDNIKDHTLTIRDLYSSLSITDDAIKSKIEEIIKLAEHLINLLDTMQLNIQEN